MQALPLSMFPLSRAGQIAFELTLPDSKSRLVLHRSDADYAELMQAVETEIEMVAALDAELKTRVIYTPRVGGVRCAPGRGVDFILSDRVSGRRIGLHALASIEGIDSVFLQRLVAEEPGLESLSLVSLSSAEACEQAVRNIGRLQFGIEILGGRPLATLAAEAVESLWDELATPLVVPLTASFKKSGAD